MSGDGIEYMPVTGMDRGAIQANGYGMVQLGPGDDQQVVIFRWESIRDDAKSRTEGRPIYTRQMYVTIHPPGERLNIIDRPVQESDKRRWPRQWNAFVQNRAYVPEGTPIAMLFPVNPEIADMLRGFGIHTVELLSKLTPDAIDTIGMGAQDWVNKAKRYLEQSRNGVDYHEIEKLRVEHQHETNALKNQIADLTIRLNALQSSVTALPVHQLAQLAQPVAVPPPPLPEPEKWAAPPAGFISDQPEPPRRKPGRPPKNRVDAVPDVLINQAEIDAVNALVEG
jgi:hypothetical protein